MLEGWAAATEPPVEQVPALVAPEGQRRSSRVGSARSKGFFFFPRKMRLAWSFVRTVHGFMLFLFFFSLLVSFGGRKSVLYWAREEQTE